MATNSAHAVLGHAYFIEGHAATIEHQQSASERLPNPGKYFSRLGGLNTANDAHQRRKHTHGGALRFFKRI